MRLKQTWDTYSGLFTLADLMGFVGFWLYKGAFRRTIGVALVLGGMLLLGKKVDALGVDLKTALSGTGAFFVFSFVGGFSLMLVSGTFSKAALTKGETKGSNLLEDMKKDRKEIHRDRLWHQVYRYEQVLHPTEDRRAELKQIHAEHDRLEDMCDPNRAARLAESEQRHCETIIHRLGLTEDGWRIAFEHAMQVPRGIAMLAHRYRYDLTYIKDWYDGAPFHHTDTKLSEHFDYHGSLTAARADLHLSPMSWMGKTRRRMTQKMWFKLITRAVQLRVANACAQLDRQFPNFQFTTDLFLWPTRENAQMVRDVLGEDALDLLNTTRHQMFRKVFHHDFDLAHKLMQKAIYPNFAGATELRQAYDPQYVVGELSDEWCTDVHRYDRAFRQTPLAELKRQRLRRMARIEQRRLRNYLRRYPDLVADVDPAAHRAVRVAYHINHHHLKDMIDADRAPTDDAPVTWLQRNLPALADKRQPDRPRCVADILAHTITHADAFTRKLLAVRMHHELTRLELEDYEFYLKRILQ
ncbi:MAG: hypothetical protein GC159_20010 [Phycisphaera sp.]|nr:hypothetical protein [Phycisphaera sp.]